MLSSHAEHTVRYCVHRLVDECLGALDRGEGADAEAEV
jgi:hypothetical protein